jgi:hypothetical protein
MMVAAVDYDTFKRQAQASASAFRVFWTTDQGPFQIVGSPMNGEDIAFTVTMDPTEKPDTFETDFPQAIQGTFISVG